MPSNYPNSLDDFPNPQPGSLRTEPSHAGQHSDANDAIEKLQAKLGTGASPAGTALDGDVLTRQGDGTTAWEALPSTTHEANTTDVHGIADTTVLETISGSQAKVDAGVTTHETNEHGPVPIEDEAGAAYTPVLTDQGKVKRFTDEALVTITVPTDVAVAFPVGAEFALLPYGAAGVAVVGDGGVTVRNAGSLAQYELAVLLKVATDEWVLTGNVT